MCAQKHNLNTQASFRPTRLAVADPGLPCGRVLHVYKERTTGEFGGMEYPPREKGVQGPEQILKYWCKIVGFEAI